MENPSLPSAIRPVPHSAEIPAPVFAHLDTLLEDMGYDEKLSDSYDADFELEQDSVRQGFNLHEISDLARNLGLSKMASEILDEKNLLEKGAKESYFRSTESAFLHYFRRDSSIIIIVIWSLLCKAG